MPAKAKRALSPFNSSNWYDAINAPIDTANGAGNFWDMGGWHYRRRNNWTKKPKKSHQVVRDTLMTPGTHTEDGKYVPGKKVSVYKAEGYDDYMAFYPHHDENGGSREADAMAYAEAAFSENSHDNILEEDGCGHIAHIKWAQRHQVMEVTFADGSICYFFRVPSTVFGTLYHFAITKQKMSTSSEHHMLGHVFWELVRIKGQKYGARYPFEYVQHSTYKLTGSNARYFVKLDPYLMDLIAPGRAHNLKNGEVIQTILTAEEWEQIPEDVKEQIAVGRNHKLTPTNRDDDDGSLDSKGFDIENKLYSEAQYEKEQLARDQIEMFDAAGRVNDMKGAKHYREAYNQFREAYGHIPESFDLVRPAPAYIDTNGMLSNAEAEKLSNIYDKFKAMQQKEIDDRTATIHTAEARWQQQHGDIYAAYEDKLRKLPELMRTAMLERMVQQGAHTTKYYYNTSYEKDLFGLQRPTGQWLLRKKYSDLRLEPTLDDFKHMGYDNPEAAYREFKDLRRRRNRVKSSARITTGRPWTIEDLENLRGKVDKMYDIKLSEGNYTDALSQLKELSQKTYAQGKYTGKNDKSLIDSSKFAGPNDYLKE